MTQLLGHYDSTPGDVTGTQGHFLNHSWKPHIQVKLIWMQYWKWQSSEPTVSFINSVSLDQLKKVTWWHHDSRLHAHRVCRHLIYRSKCSKCHNESSVWSGISLHESFYSYKLYSHTSDDKWNQIAAIHQSLTHYSVSVTVWHWLERYPASLRRATWMLLISVLLSVMRFPCIRSVNGTMAAISIPERDDFHLFEAFQLFTMILLWVWRKIVTTSDYIHSNIGID